MIYKTFLVLLAAVSVACDHQEFGNYEFEQYLMDFGLRFPSSEMAERRSIFLKEFLRVKEHNSKNLPWKEEINRFSVLTAKEKAAYLGRHKSVSGQSHKLRSGQDVPPNFRVKPLPETVDWRNQGVVTSVKDQGHCGSCWAFASTAVIESHVAIKSGLLFDLSTQQVAMCSPNPDHCGGSGGCNGATSEVAFDYVTKNGGLLQEFQYPYTSYYGENFDCAVPKEQPPLATINGYVKLPENNYTSLMNAIATVGPIAISVDASTWHSYKSGVYAGCNQVNPDINHAVVLVGYGEENGQKYWLVRNSWNPKWGEKGYIKIARSDNDEDLCGTDVTPLDGSACNGDTTPVKVCGTCGILYDSSYPLNADVL